MKNLLLLVMAFAITCLAVPKPMESVENYNIMLIHGAYGKEKGFLDITDSFRVNEAYAATRPLDNGAALGRYHENFDDEPRLLHWLTTSVFEEPEMDVNDVHPKYSHVYQWRSFSNPANSSYNNAFELGSRSWYMPGTKYEHRRSMMEEAQEVKASYILGKDTLHGQIALDSIRKNSDLYRQLASRYILIGHSMGGVVSREYVQGDFYNGDVDKIITLDSPHEGTGALNMQLHLTNWLDKFDKTLTQSAILGGTTGLALAIFGDLTLAHIGTIMLAASGVSLTANASNLGIGALVSLGLEDYENNDSLVCYVDPNSSGCSNIVDLLKADYVADSMPMFRLLAGKNSMTFTDPTLGWKNPVSYAIPEALTAPMANVFAQISGGGSFTVDYVNAVTGFVMGLGGGVTVQAHGSSLVETSNGLAEHVPSLNDPAVDTKRETFNAAYYAGENGVSLANDILLGFDGAFALATVLPYPISKVTRAGLAMMTASLLGITTIVTTTTGVADLSNSHQRPLYAKNIGNWYSNKKSFTPLASDSSSYTPYLMEDFLYEKPFVNLALNDSRTMDSLSKISNDARDNSTLNRNCFYGADADENQFCEIGLYGKDSTGFIPLNRGVYSNYAKTPLKFKSSTDWDKMGIKLDRWERVPGLTPEGKEKSDYVPIRHVERYNVPAITVDDWIEKYSFVVDDLMPHRLRQIRMEFNYQEEIAWECDITKDSNAENACAVYKRTSSEQWHLAGSVGKNGYVPHPVKKNGLFEFEPRKYGYKNLLAIQKDNQNTVTISTVNKIGLSNTQSFYYLFKATDNMLQPSWPKRDIILNKVNNFKAYASALGYQGFYVAGANDEILPQFDGGPSFDARDMVMSIDKYTDFARKSQQNPEGIVYDSSSAYFVSKQEELNPVEGNYLWRFHVDIRNSADVDSKDSSNSYEVPFRVDRTAPKFTLSSESVNVNPDSNSFVTRFTWDDTGSVDIRAMRMTLEKFDGEWSFIENFPAMSDVSSSNFAVQWSEKTRKAVKEHGDGLYRIKAYAVDNAVPDSAAYGRIVSLVDAIMKNPEQVDSALWPNSNDSLNESVVYESFYVDTKAPVMSNEILSGYSSSYTGLNSFVPMHPARNSQFAYATEDSLLKIAYTVSDSTNEQDSVPVIVSLEFVRSDDTTKAYHAGDSIWIKNSSVDTSWTESSGMRLDDGDYSIQAHVRDAAGNDSLYALIKKVRVDKTAPNIVSLVSTSLVYPDTAVNYSARLVVNEKNDVASNRTGMYCYYRVSGSSMKESKDPSWKTTKWTQIANRAIESDSITFVLDSVGDMHGKCYLEAECVDAAGNVSVKTDLFYIGERTPVITSPKDMSNNQLVAITGIAPPANSNDSIYSIYRLRYASAETTNADGSLIWETSNISVISALQSTIANASKFSQSSDAILGYLDRNLGNNKILSGTYDIELCTCSDSNCVNNASAKWICDTAEVFLGEIDSSETITPLFTLNKNSIKIGSDTLNISLGLTGNFRNSFFMRIYAVDANNVGMFDESESRVLYNPYYGAPADTLSDSAAVWFYEIDGKYHLQWKGLPAGDTLDISYDSLGFAGICEGVNGNVENCISEPIANGVLTLPSEVSSYFEDFPELTPLTIANESMRVTGKNGHLVMTATKAFRVSRRNALMDTTLAKLHVYFGNSSVDGFSWISANSAGGNVLDPLMIGWTISPQSYGLHFRWNGIPENGRYPADGIMKIYAEISENITENPKAFKDSAVVNVTTGSLEIVIPDSIPDFIMMAEDTTKVCSSQKDETESCEQKAFKLGSMVVKYGVKNKDARVKISVLKGNEVKKVLQDTSDIKRANVNDFAYQVLWNGKDSVGTNVAEEGKYVLKFEAYPVADGSQKSVSSSVDFLVKKASAMTDLTPDNPKDPNVIVPSIYVVEAKPEGPGVYRYEPTAIIL